MSALLGIFRDTLPDANLPKSFNEAKNVLRVLGLDCQKIDACPNDCMLYREEHANATSCYICKTSRWKVTDKEKTNGKDYKNPAKILWYFPIKKRLRRLFMCPKTAKYMIWHKNNDSEDELLDHPRDGEAWKKFDKRYRDFAKDARSVRLGLASDGFNPFHNMSIVHSTWPVILINYNLPLWLLTKPEFWMLALLIPDPLSPGNDIHVYLQPLIKDLKELWEVGLELVGALVLKRGRISGPVMHQYSSSALQLHN